MKKKDKEMEEKEVEINDETSETAETEPVKEEEKPEESSVAELEEKLQNLQDALLRKAAEFENYKRRTENDQLNLLKYAAESFILKIIPVYDDLGRSVDHLEESNIESLKEGLKLVYDKFTKILEEQGIKKLETKGEVFDVDYHEALMQQPSNEVPANTVLTEIESGYTYKEKVIKHAKVVVSQEIEEPAEEKSDSTNENEE